jgi:hypothetical protein
MRATPLADCFFQELCHTLEVHVKLARPPSILGEIVHNTTKLIPGRARQEAVKKSARPMQTSWIS